MTEASRKVLRKGKRALTPKDGTEAGPASIEGGYAEFSPADMLNGMTLRIKELEAQHYMHNLALIEIESVAENHEPDHIEDALKARRVAMSDLALQIERLKVERSTLEVVNND